MYGLERKIQSSHVTYGPCHTNGTGCYDNIDLFVAPLGVTSTSVFEKIWVCLLRLKGLPLLVILKKSIRKKFIEV